MHRMSRAALRAPGATWIDFTHMIATAMDLGRGMDHDWERFDEALAAIDDPNVARAGVALAAAALGVEPVCIGALFVAGCTTVRVGGGTAGTDGLETGG